MRFFLFILILLTVGCSPQKRLNRLLKKHPTLLQIDTLVVKDTFVVKEYRGDTTLIFKYHDTVVNNERIFIKHFYDTLTREIHYEYICIGDTVIKETFIPYEKIVIQELTWWQKYGTLVIFGIILLAVLMVLNRLKKILP
tara:strand:+ start:277 stop:696 length:420 start_codon:yes stop_codon:yes gene_type:complete